MTTHKILITGGSGFTGQHAKNYFENAGWETLAVQQKDRLANDLYTCDLTNKEKVEELIKESKPQFVLHLAGLNQAQPSWDQPVSFIEGNMMSTVYLLDAIRKYSPESKVLLVGSILQRKLDEPILHPYGFSKSLQHLIGEAWQELYQLKIFFVKSTNLIGPGTSPGICSKVASKIIESEKAKKDVEVEIEITNPLKEHDFLDVRDAVRCYHKILEKGEPGVKYEVGSGEVNKLKTIVDVYRNHTNLSLKLTTLACQKEVGELPDSSLVRQLGWMPQYSLDTSLQDVLSYFRRNKE